MKEVSFLKKTLQSDKHKEIIDDLIRLFMMDFYRKEKNSIRFVEMGKKVIRNVVLIEKTEC